MSDDDLSTAAPHSTAIACFITFRCYGTWLHGDRRGSVDWKRNAFGTPMREISASTERSMRTRMKFPAAQLDANRRRAVEGAVREVCERREWLLHAINVRTEHVHVLVTSPARPEKVMSDLKSWCTRRLRDRGLAQEEERIWSHHGSTRYIWNEDEFGSAWDYVVNRRGEALR